MKKINIQKIAIEIGKERPGVPVLLADLRIRVRMSVADFDQAILEMAKNGYFLTRNAHPTDSLTNAEKKMMIPDGNGNFYFAINPREEIATDGLSQLSGTPSLTDLSGTDAVHQLSELSGTDKKAGRGGLREGAGRPAVKTKVKRVQLQGARIPGWLMDWLKAEGDMGSKIEAALIEKYGLTPPAE